MATISDMENTARITRTDAKMQKEEEGSALSFPVDLRQLSKDYEIDLINNALKKAQYNQKIAAQLLGLTYHQLRAVLKKFDLLKQPNQV